jgi:glutamate formiminotransferase / 5-formyltetrahydrofolate cyclo-ligase
VRQLQRGWTELASTGQRGDQVSLFGSGCEIEATPTQAIECDHLLPGQQGRTVVEQRPVEPDSHRRMLGQSGEEHHRLPIAVIAVIAALHHPGRRGGGGVAPRQCRDNLGQPTAVESNVDLHRLDHHAFCGRLRRMGFLECVVNISEGVDHDVLAAVSAACGQHLLDIHADPHHHRAVFTLAARGVDSTVEAAQRLTDATLEHVDLQEHVGVHPRFGAVDVVPFVPLDGSTMDDALAARHRFAQWLAAAHDVPSFFYGPERSLPEVRKNAFVTLAPDTGPPTSHVRAGACAVGARPMLIAYNLWLENTDIAEAKRIARVIREPRLRTLGLTTGDHTQVSCNLVEPSSLNPAHAYDLVATHARIARAELVGLLPHAVLDRIDPQRWDQLDISAEKTVEARLVQTGLDEGK